MNHLSSVRLFELSSVSALLIATKVVPQMTFRSTIRAYPLRLTKRGSSPDSR